MRLNVTSEIGKLRSVLIHLPGREIDVMAPSMMEELLFDDILYGQLTREEHRRFQQIIWYVADEVHDIQDLLEETLDDDGVRREIVADFVQRHGFDEAQAEWLGALNAERLAAMMIAGVSPDTSESDAPFELAPVPNLFFQRDPQVVIGDGVAVSSMATEARAREPLISHYVFRHHPSFRGGDLFWMDHYDEPWPRNRAGVSRRPTIEGGDVLVAQRDTLLVGFSERTNRAGIEHLAASLKASDAGVRNIIVVEIPRSRAYMHLDTVFTIINRHECLVYPPIIMEGGSEEAKIYSIDLTQPQITYTAERSLLDVLKKRGLDLEPIFCGGSNPIDQQREQWTDGANSFTLAPGVILLYERNVKTAEELARRGYNIVYEDDLLLGRSELETWTDKKYAIQIQGHELSRARGGPRCMTMPLEREDP